MDKNPKAHYYLFLVLNLFKNTYLEMNDKFLYFKFSFVDEKDIDISELNYDVISNIFQNINIKTFNTGK